VRAEELIRVIEKSGGVLSISGCGNGVRYRLPVGARSLLGDLRRMKPELLPLLRRRSFMHLAPFLGKRVWTPAGPGKLVKVEDYVTIEFENSENIRWYDPTAVIPYA
jgi:hypothetical protein